MAFAGKAVLITGASAGIGAITATKFAELGASLALVGRNAANLGKVAQSLDKFKGAKVLTIVADVSKDGDVKRIVDETIGKYGRLDILVNNAAFANSAGILDGIAPYDDLMATNVRGVYLLTSLAAPHLIETKGNVINVSSSASESPNVHIPYCLSKAALDMFTKCVALDLAPYGVRVNSVNPGVTRSTFFLAMGMSEEQSGAFYETASGVYPLKRVSDGDEIADMIVYLAGHKARGMTGSIVVIDNGHLLIGPNFMSQEKK